MHARGLAIAIGGLYLPYVVMAGCLFVNTTCDHCHECAMAFLPAGPGVVPAVMVERSLPELRDWAPFLGELWRINVIAAFFVLLQGVVLALIGRFSVIWLGLIGVVLTALHCFGALGLYAVTRA